MNSPKPHRRSSPRSGWPGRRDTRAGRRTAGGWSGRRRLWVGIAAAAAGLAAIAFTGSALASPGVTHVRSAAATSPAQGLISAFGCGTASAPGAVHCLGEVKSHRARNGRIAAKLKFNYAAATRLLFH